MSDLYRFKMADESLSHHGIEGQKWGVKNGPPYPLDASDHSAAEKKHMGYFARKKAVKEEEKQKNQAEEDTLKKERKEKLHQEFEIIDSIHDQTIKSKEMIAAANELLIGYKEVAEEYGVEQFRINLEDAIEEIIMDEDFYNTVQSKFFENNPEVKKQWDESIKKIEQLRAN